MPDQHDDEHYRQVARERSESFGLPVDPNATISEIPANLKSVVEDIEESTADYQARGCTCDPLVAEVKEGAPVDGSPSIDVYFNHDDGCPFLLALEAGQERAI